MMTERRAAVVTTAAGMSGMAAMATPLAMVGLAPMWLPSMLAVASRVSTGVAVRQGWVGGWWLVAPLTVLAVLALAALALLAVLAGLPGTDQMGLG